MEGTRDKGMNDFGPSGLGRLYHVTDRSNLEQIILNGGICSWAGTVEKGIDVPSPGGDAVTRLMDRRLGLGSHVHLYLSEPDEALVESYRNSGRCPSPYVLEISPEAIVDRDTVFFDGDPFEPETRSFGTFSELECAGIPEGRVAEVAVKDFIPFRFIKNMPDSYTAMVSQMRPTAVMFIVDHSDSMSRSTEIAGKKFDYMSEAVALIVNKQIDELLSVCSEGGEVKDLIHIAVIGYGSESYCAWDGELAGRGFVTPTELLAYKERHRSDKRPWVQARDDGNGSNCSGAFALAYTMLEEWMESRKNQYFYPPTVVHITDGEIDSEQMRPFLREAEKIKKLSSGDGNVMIWNVDISPVKMTELILPSGAELGALGYSGLSLYEASSVLPSVMTASISPLKDVSDGLAHRALGVNVSMDTLSRLLKMSVTAFMTGGKSQGR